MPNGAKEYLLVSVKEHKTSLMYGMAKLVMSTKVAEYLLKHSEAAFPHK